MKKKNKRLFFIGASLLAAFVLWTVTVRYVDVKAIGPQGSCVGLATLNGFVHSVTGVNMLLYTVTDYLGLVPIGVALGFAVFGLIQWIKRKSIFRVDRDILMLGGFYLVVIAIYVLFETVVINYRPTLIEGYLEASYPSSTTVLVMCVMLSAVIQLHARIKNSLLRRSVVLLIIAFVFFMIIGRTLSGVHWISDIIGGALFSAGLVLIYYSVCKL